MLRLNQLLLGALLSLGSAFPALAAPTPLSEIVVDVVAEDEPLRSVLERLEREHGLSYVVSGQTLRDAGTVTVRLRQVRLDEALEAICAACGLSFEVRGPVLVIRPEAGAPLPRVEEGLFVPERPRAPERRDGPGQAPPAPRPAPAAAPDAGALSQAVGTLVERALDEGRFTLQVDGARRDFYLPDEDPRDLSLQARRLRGAIENMRLGGRVALLYRRDGSRSVVNDLIGGSTTRSGGERAPAARTRPPAGVLPGEARAPGSGELSGGALVGSFVALEGEVVRVRLGRPDATAPGELVELRLPAVDDAERRKRVSEALASLQPGDRVALSYETPEDGQRRVTNAIVAGRPGGARAPEAPPAPVTAPPVAPPPPAEGAALPPRTLVGTFAGRDGEVVRLRLPDGDLVECRLPRDSDDDRERRDRVTTAIDALRDGDRILLTYETSDGVRYITNTITRSR